MNREEILEVLKGINSDESVIIKTTNNGYVKGKIYGIELRNNYIELSDGLLNSTVYFENIKSIDKLYVTPTKYALCEEVIAFREISITILEGIRRIMYNINSSYAGRDVVITLKDETVVKGQIKEVAFSKFGTTHPTGEIEIEPVYEIIFIDGTNSILSTSIKFIEIV